MTKIEEMKAQLEATKAQAKAQLEETLEANKLQLEINRLTSPLYMTRQLETEDTVKLDAIINHIEELYAVDRRKVSQTYGYGDIPNKIVTIAKAVMYSKIEEKTELLMMTGMHSGTIEDLIDAFGNTAYFSVRELKVVPEMSMDIVRVKEILQVCADDLGLVSTLKLHKFSPTNIEYQSKRALARAEEALENTLKYNEEAVDYDE